MVAAVRMPAVIWAFLFWGLGIGLPMAAVIIAMGVDADLTLGRIAALPLTADHGPSLREGTLGLRDEMPTQVPPSVSRSRAGTPKCSPPCTRARAPS